MSYSTREVALALGIPLKRLDNILSAGSLKSGVAGARGRSRLIPVQTVDRLALVLLLGRDLGIPTARGIEIGDSLLRSPDGTVAIGVLGELRYDIERLRDVVRRSLADTLDGVARPRRGRPPDRKSKPRDASL